MNTLFFTLIACDIPTVRVLPRPTFQAESIFHEKATVSVQKPVVDPFAQFGTKEEVHAEVTNAQVVSVLDIFTSTLPQSTSALGWNVTTNTNEFSAIYSSLTGEANTPEVIMYALNDSANSQEPTFRIRRFLSIVDPMLNLPGIWQIQPIFSTFTSAFSVTSAPMISEIENLAGVFSPTLGLGLGYASLPNTFTGWKWIGENSNNVMMRFAQTTGSFRQISMEDMFDVEDLNFQEIKKDPSKLTKVLDLKTKLYSTFGTSAMMIVGSMKYRTSTVHIAIICMQQPDCSEKEAVITFLNSMTPATKENLAMVNRNTNEVSSIFHQFGIFSQGDISEQFGSFSKDFNDIFSSNSTNALRSLISTSNEIISAVEDTIKEGIENIADPFQPSQTNSEEEIPSEEPVQEE